MPYAPDREAALPAIERFLAREPKTDILWIADGVELGGASAFSRGSRRSPARSRCVTDGRGALALAGADNEAGALKALGLRAPMRSAPSDRRGARARRPGAGGRRAPFDFGAKSAADARFDLPVELRNEVSQSRHRRRTFGRRDLARRRALAPAPGRDRLGRERRRRAAAARAQLLSQARAAPFADVSEWRDSATRSDRLAARAKALGARRSPT